MKLFIGSGDTKDLLSGLRSKAYNKLWERYVAIDKPNYNAFASPIDALRTGAILEERFYYAIDDKYLKQYKVINPDMDASKSTIDFAEVEQNRVVDFIELKSAWLTDFQEIYKLKGSSTDEYMNYLLSNSQYRQNVEQVQKQLFDTGLQSGLLCYLEVQTYNDEINRQRYIQKDEYVMFRIYRYELKINRIKERLTPFQQLKDYFKNK